MVYLLLSTMEGQSPLNRLHKLSYCHPISTVI